MISVGLRKDLNSALRLIAAKLDLDETRYKNAEEKYLAVAKWLQADDSDLAVYSPDIYPQGSFALGTVVKPLGKDEYDIDFVCELAGFSGTPTQIKQIVGDRLKTNENYSPPRLVEKPRCWRINYAGEFHLDILPARPSLLEIVSDTAIEVPDKELEDWIDSNPKGYVAWFNERMAEQYTLNRMMLAESEQKSIEEVPEYQVKTTLQQAIQLMKRNRDIEFEKDSDDKPISIIITTLAGLSYLNQADLFEAMKALVHAMPDQISNQDGVAWVMNPVNQNDNLADKWEEYPQRQTKFTQWLENLGNELDKLHKADSMVDIERLLVLLFGETLAMSVLKEIAEQKQKSEPASVRIPPVVKIEDPNKPWKK